MSKCTAGTHVIVDDYLPCASIPCQHHGACLENGQCVCEDIYEGPTCDSKYSEDLSVAYVLFILFDALDAQMDI